MVERASRSRSRSCRNRCERCRGGKQLACSSGARLAELAGEEDVAELRGAVDAHRGVRPLRLEVVEVEAARLMGVRGGGHHADPRSGRSRRRLVSRNGARSVQGERPLEALGRLPAIREQRAGVVGKHVDVLVPAAHLLGQHGGRRPSASGRPRTDARVRRRRPSAASKGHRLDAGRPSAAAPERQLGTLARQSSIAAAWPIPRVAPVSRTSVTGRNLLFLSQVDADYPGAGG